MGEEIVFETEVVRVWIEEAEITDAEDELWGNSFGAVFCRESRGKDVAYLEPDRC